MKKRIYPISAGIRVENNKFIFKNENSPDDIIDFKYPQIYQSKFGKYTYWFGYKFNDTVSSKDRSKFLHAIKGLSEDQISDNDIVDFIDRPIFELDNYINTYSISAVIYPVSGRSKLVSKIISEVGRFTSHNAKRLSFEFVKNIPSKVEFDWEQFESDTSNDLNKYNQMKKYVTEELLPAIHSLDYFSLAENVKPKYRKYIKNYLSLSESDVAKLASLKGETILIIDDINTSGATLDELVRNIRLLNNTCKIFIYTLIGK